LRDRQRQQLYDYILPERLRVDGWNDGNYHRHYDHRIHDGEHDHERRPYVDASECDRVSPRRQRRGDYERQQDPIWAANGTQAQNWNFASIGTNTWNMAVNLGPYCLDGGAAGVGTATQLWSCNGTNDQAWISAAQGVGVKFTSKQSGLCLDVRSAGTANGTVVQSYTCNGTNAQTWAVQ